MVEISKKKRERSYRKRVIEDITNHYPDFFNVTVNNFWQTFVSFDYLVLDKGKSMSEKERIKRAVIFFGKCLEGK